MNRVVQLGCTCMLLYMACTGRQVSVPHWQITYSRIAYFLGNIDIIIGTDSCYYHNKGSIYKNPVPISWKSNKRKLDKLLRQIKGHMLPYDSIATTNITEHSYEYLQLKVNNQIIYKAVKHLQSNKNISQFDSVLAMLQLFIITENNGIRY